VIELSILHYILKNQDYMVLLSIDEAKLLDSKIKSYFIKLKEYREKYDDLPTLQDFSALVNNKNLFTDVTEISKSLLPFYLDQIEERHNKYVFFDKLYSIINNEIEFEETISQVQDLLLDTQKDSGKVEEIDCSQMPEQEDYITRVPLGIGKFDEINGGLAASELALIGGHRGSGKSILALHTALSRYKLKKTVGFISIEMRASEVRFRLDAMVTGLPAKDLQFNRLDNEQLRVYFTKKANFFCIPTPEFIEMLKEPVVDKSKLTLAYNSLPRKEHKFFLYDMPLCNLSDINYIAAKLKQLHSLNYLVVDYLNIIKMPGVTDSIDWKVQINRAEGLKTIARANDVGILSPIQIDEEGKVKFAKAIEDPVDLSLLFQKSKGGNNDTLNLYTSKIRNGTDCKFSLLFNKTNLRISALRDNDE